MRPFGAQAELHSRPLRRAEQGALGATGTIQSARGAEPACEGAPACESSPPELPRVSAEALRLLDVGDGAAVAAARGARHAVRRDRAPAQRRRQRDGCRPAPVSRLRLAPQSLTRAAGARQARRPRSWRSRAHAAGGELQPSLCSGARTGSPGCAQVLLQCALALGLAAFGVVVVAGKLQVSAPSLLSSAQCSAHGPVACRSQPISLSAMMDGASASFEDFNPDFMVRCLFTGPVHHQGYSSHQRCLFMGRLSA